MKISLRRRHALTVADGSFSHNIDYFTIFMEILNLKLHYWFKSYGDFAEGVDFAHWWSFIGKGLRLQPAQQACFNMRVEGGNNPLKLHIPGSNRSGMRAYKIN